MIKWIGQHIWDFVSRFRNDIYIVNKETSYEHKVTTSTNDVDVVVPSGPGSLAGVRLLNTYQEDPVFNFNVGRAALNIKDDLGGGNPSILLQTGSNSSFGTSMTFTKARLSGGSIVAGVDDDVINNIHYNSYNDASTPEAITFAQVLATIKDASDTDEAGTYQIKVTASDGSTSALQNAFQAIGSGTNNIVSTTIGHGGGSTATVAGNLNANGADHSFTSATADKPVLSLTNTNTTSTSNASLKFIKDAADVAVGEFLGEILFIGDNDAGTPEQIDYAKIWSRVVDETDGSEKGSLYLGVASYDGEMQPGISIESGNSEDEVDVIIGNGANSITHIDGYVTVGSLASATDSVSIAANVTVGNNGGNFKVEGSKGNGTNKNGGPLQLSSGGSTGTGEGGNIILQGTPPGSSGSSSNSTLSRWTFYTGKTVPYAAGPATGIGMQNWVDLHTNTFENSFTAGQAYEATYLKYAPAGTQNVTGNIGEIFYLHTDGSWAQADASATSTGATQLLGVIALGGALPNKGIILEGFIRIPTASILNTPGSGAVDGLPVYISTTAGHFDFTAPSGNDEYVRCVGYALDDHSGDVLVYFKPDNTFVKITA